MHTGQVGPLLEGKVKKRMAKKPKGGKKCAECGKVACKCEKNEKAEYKFGVEI